jgi:C4-dicarboxylate-specific signal transduction histidine kinase
MIRSSATGLALQTAGTLAALIFLVSSVFEVLAINNLYQAQHQLIGFLLCSFAAWAWLEVALIKRQPGSPSLRTLRWLMTVQFALVLARHASLAVLNQPPLAPLDPFGRAPSLEKLILFLALDFVLFLWICHAIISAFSSAEAASREREQRAEVRRRQELEQKLKTSLTAAAVVHEIQQPLATILLNCRLAESNLAAVLPGAAAADLERRLRALSGDAQQVVTTMERMRMLLRNVETAHSKVDLAANLHSALVFLNGDLCSQQVQLIQEGLEQPCPLQGDGAQLQMAAVNLIRNALQAMEGQPAASRRILVQLQRQPQQLRVLVADSGPGFPPTYSSDTSWELLKSTKATGMGLGLFLAETAATNHHGRLRIGRSQALGGAEVVLELPLKPD